MSIFEYDKEEEERKLRKAEYEAGVESGIAEGKRLAQKEGTIALSRLCLKCKNKCKQSHKTIVVFCPKYKSKRGAKSVKNCREYDDSG